MRVFRFYKESNDKWFVDLPEWLGDKADLEMVLGADILLDMLSVKGNNVSVSVDLSYFVGCETIELVTLGKNEGGGYYLLKNFEGKEINLELWICDVLKFVFGIIPNKIYFKKLC